MKVLFPMSTLHARLDRIGDVLERLVDPLFVLGCGLVDLHQRLRVPLEILVEYHEAYS